MKLKVRLAQITDLRNYTDLLQRTYTDAYTEEELGITENCFSKEIFNSKSTQEYLKSKLLVTDQQKTWLAFNKDEMVGSITICDHGNVCELSGFYVSSEYQGQGIGKHLFDLALEFSRNKDISLDIYQHNKKGIAIYKKWGFEIDQHKGSFFRHWEEWPPGLQAECVYMILRNNKIRR